MTLLKRRRDFGYEPELVNGELRVYAPFGLREMDITEAFLRTFKNQMGDVFELIGQLEIERLNNGPDRTERESAS